MVANDRSRPCNYIDAGGIIERPSIDWNDNVKLATPQHVEYYERTRESVSFSGSPFY